MLGLLLWGDLDFRCLGMVVCGLGIGLSVVSFCLGSRWFLFGLMVVGMSSLCHDVWIMGSLSEWGCFLTLDSGDDFRGGVEMVVTMFTVFEDVLSYAGLGVVVFFGGVRVG